jgi:hypothetical protein
MTHDADRELLPCPFCGSNNISSGESLGKNSDGTYNKQTGCVDCGALGSLVDVVDIYDNSGCDAAWNKRVTL